MAVHSAGAGGANQYHDFCKAEMCSGTQFSREHGPIKNVFYFRLCVKTKNVVGTGLGDLVRELI